MEGLTDLPGGVKFLQEFYFGDCMLFVFFGKKFLQIWISDFPAGKDFSWMSDKLLSGISCTVFV